MVGPKVPELTPKRLAFLRLYRRLEMKLGGPPSYTELGKAHGGYAEGSEAAGAQRMGEALVELGLIEMPRRVGGARWEGGGTTKLGLRTLKHYEGQEE